jgi:hypothetical protein
MSGVMMGSRAPLAKLAFAGIERAEAPNHILEQA